MEKTRLSDFDYELPPELIAQEPVAERDRSRMLVLRRHEGVIGQNLFSSFPDFLNPDDLLVMNNTRVIPARLIGRRGNGGGEAELLLLHRLSGGRWTAMVRPGRKLKPGAVVEFARGLRAVIDDYAGQGQRIVSFGGSEPLEQALPLVGQVPLPPYIKQELKDPDRSQTIYAVSYTHLDVYKRQAPSLRRCFRRGYLRALPGSGNRPEDGPAAHSRIEREAAPALFLSLIHIFRDHRYGQRSLG